MPKNIIFIVNLKEDKKPNRTDPYKYSINSWKNWAKKHNNEVFVLTERVYPEEYMKANWHKSYALTLLEANNIDYDQVCIVDADTIVHPDCPDFFKESEGKFCAVMNDGCYEWVTRSIEKYGEYLWPDITIKTWEYFNSGFIVVGKKHKEFFDKVHKYYEDNVDKIKYAQNTFHVGNDQTPLNYLVRHFNIDLKIFTNCYNLQDIFRKNLLHFPNHSWFSDELHFLKAGWVYHFNAIPQHERHAEYWLKRTYNHLYGEL